MSRTRKPRPTLPTFRRAFAAILFAGTSHAALAQSAAPGNTIQLDEIVVEGQGARMSAAETQARRVLEATPGGTAVIGAAEHDGKASVSIADTLNTTPGVIASSFLGGNDQPKIHMRGSGLQSNPVERGVFVLQDGLPLNRADGSYIVGLIEPRQADFIEVFRGYTANRLGATVLGGALNFVSPTGVRNPGTEIEVEGGSYGQISTTARSGVHDGKSDAFGQISTSHRDGYRDWNESQRTAAAINGGTRLSDNVVTRLFFGYTNLMFDVPGPLSRTLFEADPRQAAPGATANNAGPNAVRDKPRRETEQFRAGSRTTITFDASTLDLAFGYTRTDDSFRFPIGTGVRDTVGGDATASLRYAYKPNVNAALPLFEASALYILGDAARAYSLNDQGVKGALYGRNQLNADTLSLFSGFNLPVAPALTLSPSVAYTRASRDNVDLYTAATRPRLVYNSGTGTWSTQNVAATNTSFSRAFDGVSPSVALSYQLAPQQMVFAALTRSFEAPTFDDLLEATGGTPNAGATGFATPNLKAQTATTAEVGWRGKEGRFGWDAVAYYSWIDDELIRAVNVSGATTTSNADKTTHFGIELGANAKVTDKLTARLAYTYQDFRFDNDPTYHDNRIAGAPRHFMVAALRYAVTEPWWVEAEVQWTPDDIPIDNANTTYSKAFAVTNLRTRWAVTERFSVFGEVRNLLDAHYAGATLVVGQVTNPNQALYLPADGRTFYGGMKVRF